MSLRQWAKKATILDIFPKVEGDNQARSEQGGFLSVLLACFLFMLTWSEFKDYRTVHTSHKFVVDSTIDTMLQINVDLTVAMPCQTLLVHLVDAAGQRSHLNDDLKMIPAEFSLDVLSKHRAVQDSRYAQEIIEAARGRSYNQQVANDLGACRIFGSVQTTKVAANLHITPAGHGYFDAGHVDHDLMNLTHRIDRFSFGHPYPNLVNPLDNSVEISQSTFEIFQYFISIVPTTYIDRNRHTVFTNQYAVTDYRKGVREENARQVIPGIFFKYDITPISVTIKESRTPFWHFVVRLCGIIGGSVTTVGFIYRATRLVFTGGKEDPKLYATVHRLMRHV